jgi:argininosuccinate lyase
MGGGDTGEAGLSIGRLTRGPHPLLFELLYEPRLADDRVHLLRYLLDIDAAHVVMLHRRGILTTEIASPLLALNQQLMRRTEAGEELFAPTGRHRGLYLLYERHYIERLGPETGGAAHVARSRNDINATLTRMRVRDRLAAMLGRGIELSRIVAAQAEAHAETLMPGFTHLQPAQPSTLGHYLAAVGAELLRSLTWLSLAHAAVDRLPMGAASGYGTSFPIDPALVGELLGFSQTIVNSLDAVASRDYVVQILSALALTGATITRASTDLQAWGSEVYGFLWWPDDLVSTSSIMPQKRNAFVFENVRGLCVRPIGALIESLAGLKNTPFANSIEVSAESTYPVWEALDSMEAASRLLGLLVANMRPDATRMELFLRNTHTTASAVADSLVREAGISFRTSHEIVSKAITKLSGDAIAASKRALEEAGAALGHGIRVDESTLASVLDPRQVVESALYGGGPASGATRGQAAALRDECDRLAAVLAGWSATLTSARARLRSGIQTVCGDQGRC